MVGWAKAGRAQGGNCPHERTGGWEEGVEKGSLNLKLHASGQCTVVGPNTSGTGKSIVV